LHITPWRRDRVMAFVPSGWAAPAHATPAWLAGRPLILNDSSTHLSRLISEWFATRGEYPRARIELNYNEAIKSLVAAGYGAALLPQEAATPLGDPRINVLPLRPALWRPLGIAQRVDNVEVATKHVVHALALSRTMRQA
jgi:DNA-binding transcriptional LysR family regulator